MLRSAPPATPAGVSYFGPKSVIRRVQGERAVALSGPRALLMQAAHPLAVAGLLAHSSALEEPYDRLARTAEVMSLITFGPRDDADRVTRHVRAMHRAVRGRLPQAVGPFAAGTPYRADDPRLLMWILYTLIDSSVLVYRTYVGRLSERDRAALWEDYRIVGRLFGLRDSDMPSTLEELDAYGAGMLGGGELVVGDWARRRARQIVLEPPVPQLARPLLETVNFITVALLPDVIRRQYGFAALPPAAVRRAMVAAGALYVRRGVIPFLPAQIRRVPAARKTGAERRVGAAPAARLGPRERSARLDTLRGARPIACGPCQPGSRSSATSSGSSSSRCRSSRRAAASRPARAPSPMPGAEPWSPPPCSPSSVTRWTSSALWAAMPTGRPPRPSSPIVASPSTPPGEPPPTRRVVTLLETAGERTIITLGERIEPRGADPLAWERIDEAEAVYFTAGDGAAAAECRRARALVATPRARAGLEACDVTIDALVYSGGDADERGWADRLADRTRLMVETEGANGGRWWGESQGRWPPVALPGPPA